MRKTTAVRKLRDRNGFSLLELLAVVTIMGILMTIVVPRVSLQASNAKEKMCFQFKGDLNTAIETYRFEKGVLPTDLEDLRNGDLYPEAIPKCPVANQAYEINSTTGRISGHTHP